MDLTEILYIFPGVVIGLSLHEYAHAQVATWLGDNTPRYQGRLTTNPVAHIDIVGFLMLLFAGFGWAKPVQINPNNFKNKKRDDILVSLAGPLMNLFIALVFLIFMKIVYFIPVDILNDGVYEIIMNFFDYGVWINIVLFIFNLLPIPPLDGHHILCDLIGLKDKEIYNKVYSMGRMLLLILIVTNIIDKIISPPINLLYDALSGIFF